MRKRVFTGLFRGETRQDAIQAALDWIDREPLWECEQVREAYKTYPEAAGVWTGLWKVTIVARQAPASETLGL